MAETGVPSAVTETKKDINPRVEIDTSPRFESVKEAVDRFGGSGPWIPLHLLRLAAGAPHQEIDEDMMINLENMEEQAVLQLERDVIAKEQETLNVLKQLEAAKQFVKGLKVNLCPLDLSPGLMFMELNQAKFNLNKTSGDLAVIQASVESLNKKIMTRDKLLLERKSKMQIPNSQQIEIARGPGDISMTICKELKGVNFEAEHFNQMTEASRYEVIKAMTEIERTKNSIKMAEMRLNAAKKMEEAAKAVQVIALLNAESEINSSDDFMHKFAGLSLSFEEYRALTRKAQQGEDLCKTKFIDTNALQRINDSHQVEVPILEKFDKNANDEKKFTDFKFRNSHPSDRNPSVINGNESHEMHEKSVPDFRTTTSIGDILTRKLVLQDDIMVGRHVENHSERQHISLSQMLREQSGLILQHSPKPAADKNVEKQYFIQRKRFGFIQVPFPTKQNKKRMQPLNLR